MSKHTITKQTLKTRSTKRNVSTRSVTLSRWPLNKRGNDRPTCSGVKLNSCRRISRHNKMPKPRTFSSRQGAFQTSVKTFPFARCSCLSSGRLRISSPSHIVKSMRTLGAFAVSPLADARALRAGGFCGGGLQWPSADQLPPCTAQGARAGVGAAEGRARLPKFPAWATSSSRGLGASGNSSRGCGEAICMPGWATSELRTSRSGSE
mmetsp:Transcript_79145/g.220011  ORF Transcript_79145/g.220011 Transcript_79145/m.220011 type:complete len:207 (-) Transcript_79145:668-1288(-)